MGLPEGTVTFLFSDIEGSTRLLARLGDARYAEILDAHHALLREAFARHGGHEVDMQGDGFFVAFARASDALGAALDAQIALHAHPWPPGAPVRVRMGVHAGEVLLVAGDYMGLAVHRTQRICAAGHGGQVLVSEAARELAGPLPEGASLADRGRHRLKDLAEAEHLFQLVHPVLGTEFPPLRSVDIVPNNLPAQPTTFVGREGELAEIGRLLRTTRVLTITGAGGAGKTRLAVQLAADDVSAFPDGVWFADLAPLTDAELVADTVAAAVGVPPSDEPPTPVRERLVERLRPRTSLVVFDNCEHLLESAARIVADLVASCPDLRVVSTSREPLGIPGETCWRMPSMSQPEPGSHTPADVLASDAARLFCERATQRDTAFVVGDEDAVHIAQICRRLDGIPLAIELAAARTNVLTCAEIATRLDDCFRLLTGGSRTALERQQTLRATIDWSYALLTDAQRTLLRRLSAFAGGFTLDAAEGVCAGDGVDASDVLDLLSALVDRSLVLGERAGSRTRYRLPETIRQYVREKLAESGESDDLRRRHLLHFVAWVSAHDLESDKARHAAVLDVLEAEVDNLRAALEWAAEYAPDDGLRLAASLPLFWMGRGSRAEGLRHLETLLERADQAPSTDRARGLRGAGFLTAMLGDFERSWALREAALSMARSLRDDDQVISCLTELAQSAWFERDLARARQLGTEALEAGRRAGRRQDEGILLGLLGAIEAFEGHPDAARERYEESLAVCRELGSAHGSIASLRGLGDLALDRGDTAEAVRLSEQAVDAADEAGCHNCIALARYWLGAVLCEAGHPRDGLEHVVDAAAYFDREGARPNLATALEMLGAIAEASGLPELAASLFGAASAHRSDRTPRSPQWRERFERRADRARASLGDDAFAASWDTGRVMPFAEILALVRRAFRPSSSQEQ